MSARIAISLLIIAASSACWHFEDTLPFHRDGGPEIPVEQYFDILPSGKLRDAPPLKEVYEPADLEYLPMPAIDETLEQALRHQLELLDITPPKKSFKRGALELGEDDLRATIELLLRSKSDISRAKDSLEAYQVWGGDQKGHVKFTGYFTPTLKVRLRPDSVYRYPFYRRPVSWEGPLPSRQQIDGEGALAGSGLEIAYAADPVDVYYTHIQGSALVEFADTSLRALLVYEGANKRPYRSIERYLKNESEHAVDNVSIAGLKKFFRENPGLRDTVLQLNPSYSFFRLEKRGVTGAGQTPLSPEISVAADRRYFPLGSVLLAAVPVFDKKGVMLHHEFRILLPQDVGGAIRGPGHLDVYAGPGPEAQRHAGKRKHYGMVWVLKKGE